MVVSLKVSCFGLVSVFKWGTLVRAHCLTLMYLACLSVYRLQVIYVQPDAARNRMQSRLVRKVNVDRILEKSPYIIQALRALCLLIIGYLLVVTAVHNIYCEINYPKIQSTLLYTPNIWSFEPENRFNNTNYVQQLLLIDIFNKLRTHRVPNMPVALNPPRNQQ